MTPLERGLFNLALTLHKTVNELLDTMTPREYIQWNVFFEERERERVMEDMRSQQRIAGGVDFSDPDASQQLISMVNAAGGGKKPKGAARG